MRFRGIPKRIRRTAGYDDFGNYRDFDEEEDEEKGLLQENSPERRRKVRRKIHSGGNDAKNDIEKRKILPVILALICAIPLSIVLLNAFGDSGKTVKIPDVLGMTEEEAAQDIGEGGAGIHPGHSGDERRVRGGGSGLHRSGCRPRGKEGV